MWLISDVLAYSLLGTFFGLFFQADYKTDVIIHEDIKIVEKNANAKIFEFSPAAIEATNAVSRNRFPANFSFGAASSAYQIEGAYNRSDKGPSVWDYWTHQIPSLIKDESNGDVACDSFDKWSEDVRLVKDLEANYYRFSLSWTRLCPNGMSNFVSPEGVRYYNELINALIIRGVKPMVTIHHFDIPHKLQLLGGWTSPKMVEYFENYARVVFTYFGDRVKHWVTINDPWELCNTRLGNAYKPIYNESGIGVYLCGHHVLLAHAQAYRLYRDEFQWIQNGKVGISLSGRWFEPEDYTSPEDAEAAEVSHQFANNWFLNPLLGDESSTGADYPDVMRLAVELRSASQRYRSSRLPKLSPEQSQLVSGSLDFLGLSFFTTYSVRSNAVGSSRYFDAANDDGVPEVVRREASIEGDMAATWLPYEDAFGVYEVKNTAENFGKLLLRLNRDYVLPQVYVTANGYPDFGETHDEDRAIYIYDHLSELLRSMKSGLDVRGYFVWSLMDSFEWTDGYSKRYGLFSVDFDDEDRPRTEKLSAKLVRNVFKTKKLPDSFTTKM